MKNVTIRDVAKMANVAPSTVSRYINSSGYVDSETKRKIEAAIKNSNYVLRVAKNNSKNKNNIIALLVPDICNPFYSIIARRVQTLLLSKGYIMTLFDTNNGINDLSTLAMANKMQAQGILFATINLDQAIEEALVSTKIPLVLMNVFSECNVDCVHVDSYMGTYLSTKHLISLGHKHIAFAGGKSNSIIGSLRKSGYLKALEESGLNPGPQDIIELNFSPESGYDIGRFFASMTPLPTAICCANDLIAFGLFSSLQERGIKIPSDISVTGMDDIPYAQKFSPSLTSVSNNGNSFANYATELLMDRVEGNYTGDARKIAISHDLIIRSSTALPRKNHY